MFKLFYIQKRPNLIFILVIRHFSRFLLVQPKTLDLVPLCPVFFEMGESVGVFPGDHRLGFPPVDRLVVLGVISLHPPVSSFYTITSLNK